MLYHSDPQMFRTSAQFSCMFAEYEPNAWEYIPVLNKQRQLLAFQRQGLEPSNKDILTQILE